LKSCRSFPELVFIKDIAATNVVGHQTSNLANLKKNVANLKNFHFPPVIAGQARNDKSFKLAMTSTTLYFKTSHFLPLPICDTWKV
jgi:hypothetical protein